MIGKVLYIAGLAFSGTSLLNLLFDSQRPAVRGIGEGFQVHCEDRQPGGPCATCKVKRWQDCELYRGWKGQPFYGWHFDRYQCAMLVDSGKHPRHLMRMVEQEPTHQYAVLMLSKAPHEAVYSTVQHLQWDHWDENHGKGGVKRALDHYHSGYLAYFDALQGAGLPVHAVPYRDVVRAPQDVVHNFCQLMGIPCDRTLVKSKWQQTDTHVLGGNPSMVLQLTGDDVFSFAVPHDKYLGGKYAGKRDAVFYDDAWKRNKAFLVEFLEVYNEMLVDRRQLYQRLGHDPNLVSLEVVQAIKGL